MDRTEGQDRRYLGRKLTLTFLDATKITRGADIEDNHHGHLALLGELLDVGLPGARRNIPVNGTDLVSGRVGANLFEVHAASLEDTLVLTREGGLHQSARAQLKSADLA